VALRVVEHRGYRAQRGKAWGGYSTRWSTHLPRAYSAAPGAPARVVFVGDADSGVPDLAWAMQGSGDAAIVACGRAEIGGLASKVHLPGGHVAHLRRAEPCAPLRPDTELAPDATDDEVMAAALRAAHEAPTPPRAIESPPDRDAWRADRTYPEEAHPSRELRVLALVRFYNVLRYFYPYLPLLDVPWDDVFREFLPRFERAEDARAYASAIAELAARVPDGHVRVSGGAALDPLLRGAPADARVRMIERLPVVTEVAAGEARVGDVIVSVDGEDMDARLARLRRVVPAANETWRAFHAANRALAGDPAAPARLVVRGADGEVREAAVPRTGAPIARTGPIWRMIEGTIGYVDLARLEHGEVDAMFEALGGAHAIVFDGRGYPRGTAWAIAPRINTNGARHGAQFFQPLVLGDGDDGAQTTFLQEIPGTRETLYRGRTVMLVDERTMSQGEHTGLFFAAANGTTFVGSQTSGSNGDVTWLTLPGDYAVSFSGHDVRHADGRRLQRVGLVPHVEARPTLAGIRAGRDEVLERALEVLTGPWCG
jgi:hypothetical protein